jgi:hypothetical protein
MHGEAESLSGFFRKKKPPWNEPEMPRNISRIAQKLDSG